MTEWLDLDEVIDKTEELVEYGFYEEALEILNQYIDIYSESWELCAIYGRIYTDLEKPSEAISYLRRGLQLNKNNVDCLLGLFYAYTMQHNIDHAGKYLLRAEKYHPDNEMVQIGLIWYYTEINALSHAITIFENLKKKGIVNPEAFRNAAIAYQRSGIYENAELCFKIALELNPSYDEVRDLLADLYLYIDKSSKAIDLYEEALKRSPRNVRIHSRLIYCFTQLNEFDKATSLAKKSIELYPNSPVGYIDLSYVFLNSNKAELAVEYAEKAHAVSPFDAEAYRIKGIAWAEIGNWERGYQAFKKALELDPDNTEIIRDFYHHLRNEGDAAKMEELVHRVIKIEYPYCLEDYWFLADYYREQRQNVKSFHYLNKAYKAMPGEKELIPPMVDIMLEEGHITSTIPFIMHYVSQSGWNDTMNDFARNKRFKGKWSQEGLRFLQFQGLRTPEFRNLIFIRKLLHYGVLFGTMIAFCVAFIVLYSIGILQALFILTGYIFLVFLYVVARMTFRYIRRKHLDGTFKLPKKIQIE